MAVQDYVTLEQVKAYWPSNEVSNTTLYDDMITTLCTNLSRCFDLLTWRSPGEFKVEDESTRYFDGVPVTATDFVDILNVGELASAPTSVKINGNEIDSSNYWLWPYNAASEFVPYTALRLNPEGTVKSWQAKTRGIEVTGLFGYSPEVPPDIYEALLLYVVRFVRKAQQNYLEIGTLLDTGQVMIGMKEDPDLSVLIGARKKSRLAGRSPSSSTVRW